MFGVQGWAWSSTERQRASGHMCTSCGRSYKRKSALTSHQNHECGKQPQLPCPFCQYRFKTRSNLNRHLRMMHLAELEGGVLCCRQCGRQYKWRSSLLSHQRHECGRRPRFCCPRCHYQSKVKSNMVRHCRLHHGAAF
ncbi:zinc finger protein 211-like [Bacillus rossius redtenbacheri]|uniref:zinc finger protein 211-like n=1 Tax=Bacillus rossius redtenbacheri TaxID=93214 RepID=UPI002FDE54B2